MKDSLSIALVILLGLFTPGCAKEATATSQQESADKIHELKCGCAIEGIGKCGEYIDIGGEFLRLTFPMDTDLGDKPFCKKEGLKGRVVGQERWGGYVATSFEYVGNAK